MLARPRPGDSPESSAPYGSIDAVIRVAPAPSAGECDRPPLAQESFDVAKAIADLLRLPMVVVDANGVLHFCNDAGERLLADGRFAMLRERRIRCPNADVDQRLRALIRETRANVDADGRSARHDSAARTSVLRVRDATSAQWATLYVRPLGDGGASRPVDASALVSLVFDFSSVSGEPDTSLLERSFDFTRTESRVASLLVAGASPARIAKALDVSMATVRTHLKAIFRKTGSRRQSEVVAKLSVLSWLVP